ESSACGGASSSAWPRSPRSSSGACACVSAARSSACAWRWDERRAMARALRVRLTRAAGDSSLRVRWLPDDSCGSLRACCALRPAVRRRQKPSASPPPTPPPSEGSMLRRIRTAALWGLEAFTVDCEIDVGPGLPGFVLVGLPDPSAREARERVWPALRNAGFQPPDRRVTVNLAPAERRKEGASADLA